MIKYLEITIVGILDRNIDSNLLVQYLKKFENIYFMPSFLQNRNGFIDYSGYIIIIEFVNFAINKNHLISKE